MKEIIEKQKQDTENFKVYEQLGDYYFESNCNQAYISYEHALTKCKDIHEKHLIVNKMDECRLKEGFCVHPVSFVILSYNSKNIMIECLTAIRSVCDPGSYEVVVVDSASTDGIREYLSDQEDIKLILNDSFPGFAAGCNQGAKYAAPDNDIMLLNNDAIVTPHSIFLMRLSLYSSEKVGAVGPLSNHAILEQKFSNDVYSKDEWMRIAETTNIISEHPVQVTHWLQGHALMIKRRIWNEIGGLDTRFKFGCAEDNEYGLRINSAGYRTLICRNVFIFHYGSVSMKKDDEKRAAYQRENLLKFSEKIGFSWFRYGDTRFELAESIREDSNADICVLEVGCGLANELNIINYRYPNSRTYGIEANSLVAHIAGNYQDVIVGDIETMELPYAFSSFDYIILPNILCRTRNPVAVLKKLYPYLKTNGKLMIKEDNSLYFRRILRILEGNTYTGGDGKDIRLHSFSINDIRDVLRKTGYYLSSWISYFGSKELEAWRKNNPDAAEGLRILGEQAGCINDKVLKTSTFLYAATKS